MDSSRDCSDSTAEDPTAHPLYEHLPLMEVKERIAAMLTTWTRMAGDRVEIVWHDDAPAFRRVSEGLFAAIGRELLRANQEGNAGWEVCARCGGAVNKATTPCG